LVADPEGQLSTSFLSLDHKVKDNRLQPQGWSTAGFMAMETGPVGEAANDPDYTTMNSPGSNTVRYEVPLTGKVSRAAVVRATLYYQTIPRTICGSDRRTRAAWTPSGCGSSHGI
jgi:hypothetical protein